MLHKSSICAVAKVFFNEPTQEHYLKEISKKANLAHTSVKKHLTQLVKEAIIKEKIQKKGSRNFPIYTSNLTSGSYIRAKKHFNLHNSSFYGLLNFISLKLMPITIVLFGSYCKGRDLEESDIDIYVECKKQKINLSRYEKELNRKIQLHFKEKFNNFPPELKNSIINGNVLKGFLEVY